MCFCSFLSVFYLHFVVFQGKSSLWSHLLHYQAREERLEQQQLQQQQADGQGKRTFMFSSVKHAFVCDGVLGYSEKTGFVSTVTGLDHSAVQNQSISVALSE